MEVGGQGYAGAPNPLLTLWEVCKPVESRWLFDISHGGSIYAIEIVKCYIQIRAISPHNPPIG